MRTQGNERRHGIADGRAVGDVAAQRTRIADGQRRKPPAQLVEFAEMLKLGIEGMGQQSARPYVQVLAVAGYFAQLGDLADVDKMRQIAQLLGYPQTHLGAAGQDAGIGVENGRATWRERGW